MVGPMMSVLNEIFLKIDGAFGLFLLLSKWIVCHMAWFFQKGGTTDLIFGVLTHFLILEYVGSSGDGELSKAKIIH